MPKQNFTSCIEFTVPRVKDGIFHMTVENLTGREWRHLHHYHPLYTQEKIPFAQVAQTLNLRNDKLKQVIKNIGAKRTSLYLMSERWDNINFGKRFQYYQLSDIITIGFEKNFINYSWNINQIGFIDN